MILSTDSTANLPKEYYEELNINMIPMQINLNNEIYDDLDKRLPIEDYYQKMREGAVPTTAQINEFSAREYLSRLIETGEDVLHIGFSSALSGSTATMKRVAEELNATHKNKIVVIDSLNASVGEGLLVLKAHDLMKEGKNINEVAKEIENLIPYACSYFTVDQLKYLVRGGRLSKVSGMLGTLLNIKPVLRVDETGHLVAYKKVISRRKALGEIVNICKQKIADTKYVYIAHAVASEDANRVAEMLKQEINVEPIITDLTQVIGCHTGPGLIALFFFGKEK